MSGTESTSAPADKALDRAEWLRKARHFSFFTLVDMLVREGREAVAPGGPGPARRENIRFRPAVSLGFPAADIEEVEEIEGQEAVGGRKVAREVAGEIGPKSCRFRVTVNFMGLYGPASPMPTHLTEDILASGTEGRAARDFLDIFHHRILSFLYRSWAKYRYPAQFEAGGGDPFTRRALCLIGLGTEGMRKAAGVAVVPLLRTVGALVSRRRSAVGLEGFLRAHLGGLDVRVDPCVERVVRIPSDQLTRLGRKGVHLGRDTCLGERIRDRSGSFRIVLGPMGIDSFRRFLPGGDELSKLVRLARLYLSDPLDFGVGLRLKPAEVPPLRLDPKAGLPLGLASWLAARAPEEGRVRVGIRRVDPLGTKRT